jgi:hypothetical protein
MKPQRISNHPTYKPRSYKFSSHSHILHKVCNIIEIHRSLKHKVITNQIHNKVAEAISFETSYTHLVWIIVLDSSHIQQKHQVRHMERPCPWS